MNLNIINLRKSINKAFLKVKPNRTQIEQFKKNILSLYDHINEAESEEYHKNIISNFLSDTFYAPHHYINTKGRTDLVIHNGKEASSTVGVLIETKNPSNKIEMPTKSNLNAKAVHELILYYLRERIAGNNIEVKHLIVTNVYEWFIFNAIDFDRIFAQNKQFVKQFTDFEDGRLADVKTDFFYKQIAAPFINKLDNDISCTYIDIRSFKKIIVDNDRSNDNKLVVLYKLFSPEHLLKLPFSNDSNSLDKAFYTELLHIIGLQETKQGSKKLIGRRSENDRNSGSLLENTITILNYEDCLSQIKASDYGTDKEEQLYNVALELVITWINRVLFLKLLEAQLVQYHEGDQAFKFLNTKRISGYDVMNKLFFQVLAIRESERNDLVKKKFANIPYLNSSLFEPNELEHKTVRISNLEEEYTLPILNSTVLKDNNGKRRTGELNTLEYLLTFLDSYDFASEGAEEIQEENKTLINASVLGLIFEKINGYKDGSFFTPGFVTMYMCRETIRNAVVHKFNEAYNWKCTSFAELKEDLNETIKTDSRGRRHVRKEANEIINNLKICDPAVGSGHFLVSALNEIMAIKSELSILVDHNLDPLAEYTVEVQNDELIVSDLDNRLFRYKPKNKDSQRVQETLFHEKQTIIENCLFGVDINPNSVKICRLRLWIELLKNAYYKNSPPFQGGVPEGGGGYHNLPHLKTFRKELRNNLTPAEATLWTLLKGKALDGKKFRRQHSVANYILDFYCPEERLAIELDGQGHFNVSQAVYDYERDLFLKHLGIKVLRFENKLVWDNPEGLLQAIRDEFGKRPPRPADTPPYQGGELREHNTDTRPYQGGELKKSPSRYITDSPSNQGGIHGGAYQGGEPGELETLPNIDINIKCGNSLISRFALDADLKQALKKSESRWTIESYRQAVDAYRNAQSKEQKHEMERLINEIKTNFRSEISQNDPKVKRLRKLSGELFTLTNQGQLFEQSEKEKATWHKKVEALTGQIQKLENEIDEIKSNKIYEHAFEWRFEFPEVLNNDGDFVGFDVVIGNPPYIRQEELSPIKSYLNQHFSTFAGTADLYVYFVEKGLSVCREGGEFVYILPNKWMRAGYGKALRQWIKQYQIRAIIDFNDLPVFEEATTYPCIWNISKTTPKQTAFRSAQIETLNFDYGLGFYIEEHIQEVNSSLLSDNGWSLVDVKVQKLIDKIKHAGTPLGEYVEGKIFYGIKTGLNEAFVIDKATRDRLIAEDLKSSEIIKPFLAGRDIKRYQEPKSENYLILFKNGDTQAMFGKLDEDQAWDQLYMAYPAICSHLLSFKLKAKKRYDQGQYWWELRACDYYEEFEKPKIFIPAIVKSGNYSYDQNCNYGNDKTSIIQTNDIAVLGLLNSALLDFFLKNIASTKQNGYFEYKPVYVSRLPIKEDVSGTITNSVERILNLKKDNPSVDTSVLESQIDQLVYELYGLTEEEIQIIEASVK